MNIFIIIITYNGTSWIRKCLDSCENYKIIVVDNNSSDETLHIIKNEYPEVILIEEKVNHGFGGANNIGISYAMKNNADYILLLNQDAYLEEHTVDKLIKAQQENTEYGILSPLHLNGNSNDLDDNFKYYMSKSKDLIFEAVTNNISKTIYDVPFVNAAIWMLPRKVFEIVGGFDPIFFHYGEDDNFCQRVLYHNFKIGIVPSAIAQHDREFRENNLLSEEKKLKIKEKKYKFWWANINESGIENKINKELQKNRKKRIKNLIKLNFEQYRYLKKEIRIIPRIKNKIFESRDLNKQEGNHYLDY